MSPDGRPIPDHLPRYEGLFRIVGDSGTSFKTSPAIGRAMAEWIVAGEPPLIGLAPFGAACSIAPHPRLHEHRYGTEEDPAMIPR